MVYLVLRSQIDTVMAWGRFSLGYPKAEPDMTGGVRSPARKRPSPYIMSDLNVAFPDFPASAAPVTGAMAGLLAWVERLPSLTIQRAVSELILKLDQLLGASLDTETRYRMLRTLKGAVLKTASILPKRVRAVSGLTLEQRLYDGMVRNCKRLLQDLDRERFANPAGQDHCRYWAVRNSFRFLGRQILHAVRSGRPWPEGVWQDLHDLYVYLVVRGVYGETRIQDDGRGFDPAQAYKRLLLVGLVADLIDRQGMDRETMAKIASIADASCLVEPAAHIGQYGLTLVEVSCDRPPRLKPDRLQDAFRGWVLRAPADLEVLLLNLDPFQQQMDAAEAA